MNNFKNLFDLLATNQNDIEDFKKFFDVFNMEPLFTNARRTSNIKVSWMDMRNVINQGRYYDTMVEFSNIMSMNQNNLMFEDALFDIINSTISFQKMIDNMDKLINYIHNQIEDKHQFNKWNIVFYAEVIR